MNSKATYKRFLAALFWFITLNRKISLGSHDSYWLFYFSYFSYFFYFFDCNLLINRRLKEGDLKSDCF
jgi:hypothetical protein